MANCKRKEQTLGKELENPQRPEKGVYIPTGRKFTLGESSKENPGHHLENNIEAKGPILTPLVDISAEVPNVEQTDKNDDSIIVPIQPTPIQEMSNGNDGSSEEEYVDATQMCIYWNIRGIANGSSRLALKRLIQNNSPDLVFIAEPCMDYGNFPHKWLHRSKDWNKNIFGDVKLKVVETEKALKDIQQKISLCGYNESLQMVEVKAQYQQVIESHLVDHFSNLFNQGVSMQDSGLIEKFIPNLVNEGTNAMLAAVPSVEEITHVVMNLKADSAPGPNGFGAIFFQKYRGIIKNDVVLAVLQFFLQDWILPNYNTNTIMLIPKNNEPNLINHYRPIALANFKFKTISKIIADRLASILPSLISLEQKGFIMGRNIKDGICLTSEAITILGNKSYSGNVALKIDILKAFDTLNWKFLLKTLTCFGFSSKFCNWIATILNYAKLSIGINGKQAGFFNCSNGVRQGDPLSPLIFCLAEEVLRVIKKSIKSIANLLMEYAAISGKVCNNTKSLVYAGGMTVERHKCLADILGFQMAKLPFLYLGAPIFVGRPKTHYFSFIADKIKAKLAHWKACLLSMAGRLQLIKAVIHSMLLHYITIYNWPASLNKKISTIKKIMDCFELMLVPRSPQAMAVVLSIVCSFFYQVWRARNSNRFDGKIIHWKSCITHIMARAKRVKANIDGVARGDPVLMACGVIFRNNNATHLGSFCDYMGEGNSELAELWAAMLAVQKAVNMGWRKLWIETDCMLVVKAFSDPTLVPWRTRSRWLSCHAYSQSKVLYYIFLTIPSDQYMQTKLSNMEKLMKPLVVILFLFLSVHDVSLARTKKSENKMNYIVHVSKSTIPTSFNHPSIWYKSILKSVSQSAEVLYSYDKAINGFSTSLSDEELELLKRQYGILKVTPDKKYKLHTTRTPKFLGLDKIANLFPTTNKSNDVIVGVIDSGVWPESKSFDDTGFGPIPPKWKGKCETGTNFTTSNCNKKLIGARFFAKGFEASWGPINETILYRSPRDDLGHGTHTASTAIGSTVENTSFFGYAKGTASGMAIGARVAVYKVCWKTSCMDSDILAGIDQAIADNVNILSLSLGGSKNDYFKDGIAIGAFAAMEHGILVSCSAGNSGPTPFKVDNVAPWITTVGAGTLDRDFPAYVRLGNGKNYSGVSLYKGNGLPDTLVPIIYAGNASKGEVRSAELCYSHSLAPEKVAGKIVLCDRGDLAPIFQGGTVKSAGGLGMVLANSKRDGESPLAYAHIFPATSVSFTYGKAIKNYLFSDQNSTATIVFRGTKLKVKPSPMVADFSSRGPNSITPQILKPDIIAPGVNIIAAYSKSVSPTFWAFDPRRVDFNILSGTSMACPHVSGLAALIKSIHPDWSPAVIRSALMTTAYTTYKNNQTLLDSATNKPSTPFEFGAGHVNPISALNPGLVYDLTTDDYLSFLCALNYSSVNIEIVARRKYTCDPKKQYSVTNLNYPSFAVVFKSEHDKIKHTRTLTNVGAARTYKVSVKSNVASIKILVEPKVLSFKKNEKKSYVVTFTTSTLKQNITHSFGSLEWFDGKTLVRSPIAFSWKLH
ncbi:uncharacterized protein LOC131650051 [Vicia villosa]|uniref:uncharacterized protein LOC131650051 n=1 Tax=Vicia villosa TaxID=3911 RepID=UPI00273AAFA0|nr:uncharacterized protein LOC131650051 [Vicia villosa]